jgi:pSer/pThr/pTyr-binding forkhead associated (FHA) protein
VLRLQPCETDLVLGRHRSCQRIYDDDSVSRRHASIRLTGYGLRVHDLDSTNGTWLNGIRVEGSARVAQGDELRLGRVRLLLDIG